MFRQLGTFAVLALCLFAIVIAMGSCGPDDPPPPPIEPPPPPTFKEQLVSEGPWRVISLEGERIERLAQELADGFSLGFFGFHLLEAREAQNSLRFDTSGDITWNWELELFLPEFPDDSFRLRLTIKGPYFVTEDSESSATMSLSFTEIIDAQVRVDDEVADVSEEAEGLIFGDIADDERASINGDQLRIGNSLFERVD